MKRAFLAITGTVAGLVALLSFKSHTVQLAAPTLTPTTQPRTGSRPTHSTGGGTPQASRTSTVGHHGGSGGQGRARGPVTAAPKRYVGPAVETPYGIVQVALRVVGGHISAVTLPRLSAFDSTSQMINSQAAPILVRETMAAQSARINTVSGATYTSEGYLQSLQAALNKAGL